MFEGLNDAARFELEDLRAKADGMLYPGQVVERARSENSALHRYFEWDDSDAAEAYRLQQARTVIRAVIRFLPSNGAQERVRAYVSLPSDQAISGGYRAVSDVLDDDALLAEASRDLIRQITRLRAKFGAFEQLRPILTEMVERIEELSVNVA